MKHNFQTIDLSSHETLKVTPYNDCKHLSNVNNTPIFAEEVADVATSFPIVFLKDEATGTFKLSALLGLINDENLFVDEKGHWTETYIPVALNIEPFGIFLSNDKASDRIKIDVNSAAVSTSEGQSLFEQQKESPYLIDMRNQLNSVVDASIQTEKLISELVNRNLLTECQIVIEGLSEGKTLINEVYTINTSEFSYLSNEDVLMFHEFNYWGAIYGIQHSLKQLKKLAQIRNGLNPRNKVSLAVHINKEN